MTTKAEKQRQLTEQANRIIEKTDKLKKTLVEAVRTARDGALNHALKICEELADNGQSAEACVEWLLKLKETFERQDKLRGKGRRLH